MANGSLDGKVNLHINTLNLKHYYTSCAFAFVITM